MEINKLHSNKGNIIDEILVIKPTIFNDSRGFFYESWNQEVFNKSIGKKIMFHQDNHSLSMRGVLRGLHFQIKPKAQGKLVRCIAGSIFDVAVDIRKSSPTFAEWVGITLNNTNKSILWIPEGFAHGFLSLEDNSQVLYKATSSWSKKHDRSIFWNDENIAIDWPLDKIKCPKPHLSFKDANSPFLLNAEIFP